MAKISAISLVIPMYNEEDNVEPLVNEAAEALSGFDKYEIVVVDDCSKDATVEKLKVMQNKLHQLRIIKHERNAGQSVAVINGVKNATYDWVATVDGDGQNPPSNIPKMAEAVNADWVLIAGHRADRKDSALKLLSSRIANKVRGALLRDNCPDTGCGLKLFPKALFLSLPHFRNMHRFLPALARRQGADVINVKITHRARERGVSKYGVMNRLFVGIVDMFGVMWLVRRPSHMDTNEIKD